MHLDFHAHSACEIPTALQACNLPPACADLASEYVFTEKAEQPHIPFRRIFTPSYMTEATHVRIDQFSDRMQTTELVGSSYVGHIQFYGQIHTTYTETEQQLIQIGAYQANILEGIKTSNCKHIFLESLYTDFFAHSYERDIRLARYHYPLLPPYTRAFLDQDQLIPAIRSIFGHNFSSSNLTVDQAFALGMLGAGPIAAIVNPAINLLKTISAADDQRIYELQKHPRLSSERFAALRDSFRERRALNEIKTLLDDKPGVRIGLIFGGLHSFSDQATRLWEFPPLITRIDWPTTRTQFLQQTVAMDPELPCAA